MLQQPTPEDFVLATGETHPVREFVEKAFAVVGIKVKYDRSLSFQLPFHSERGDIQMAGQRC